MTKPYRFTFIDTETTGLDPAKGHRIIELSVYVVATVDFKHFRPLSKCWTKRFNPQRPIDAGAQAVHGISSAELAICPEFKYHLPTVKRVLETTDLLVAHNLAFDADFLIHEFAHANVPFPKDTAGFCTMEEGRGMTAMGKMPNLGELCWAMDVDYDPSAAHAAEYDTMKLAESFLRGLLWGRYTIPKTRDQEAA